jgi:hypothetical protein
VIDVFSLPSPPRIVVDVLPAGSQTPEPTAPRWAGPWQQRLFGTALGFAQVSVLTVNPRDEDIVLRPALAADMLRGRQSVGAICAREGAIAGINGGYFARTGEPLGLLVIDGEYIAAPRRPRTALVIGADGSLAIAALALYAHAKVPGQGDYRIWAINEGHGPGDQLILYTRRYARELSGNLNTTRVALDRNGVVEQVLTRTEEPMTIPDQGFVLSGKGALVEQLARLRLRQCVGVQLGTKPRFANVAHILGAGPRLLKGGEVRITADVEQFQTDVARGAAPRSAVGIAAEGHAILVTVDGRGVGGSSGMTLYELAQAMRHLGARDALNLDGGGSATLVVGGRVVNVPSGGRPRSVSNALLVFGNPAKLGPATP